MSNDEILGLNEVAEMLGVAAGTLRQWRHHNKGPRSFSIGRRVAFRRSDVEEWLERQYATTAVGG